MNPVFFFASEIYKFTVFYIVAMVSEMLSNVKMIEVDKMNLRSYLFETDRRIVRFTAAKGLRNQKSKEYALVPG